MDWLLFFILLISIGCLIGSWLVPVATLIVATYFTYKYQNELRTEAQNIGTKTEKSAKQAEDNIKKAVNLDDIKKELRETFDSKVANLSKQIRKASKDGLLDAVNELRDKAKENGENGNVIDSLLSLLKG